MLRRQTWYKSRVYMVSEGSVLQASIRSFNPAASELWFDLFIDFQFSVKFIGEKIKMVVTPWRSYELTFSVWLLKPFTNKVRVRSLYFLQSTSFCFLNYASKFLDNLQ